MTTTTLSPEARRTTALFATGSLLDEVHVRKYFKKSDKGAKVLVLEDVPVFRSGVFRDSMGFQHTWEDIHMGQMTQHFDLLRDQTLFADVPVRKGHPSFLGGNVMDDLIGYHTAIRTEKRVNPSDGKEYTYILASYEILDETAQQKIESGLWRNRSAEIGAFVTNAEAEFWPVYMGVAYVDIPAVEGLNGFMNSNTSTKYSMMTEEPVSGTTTTQTQAPANAQPPLPTEQAPATEAPAPAQFAAPTQAFQFSIGGRTTADFAAVQAHINSLEQFQAETRTAGRVAFAARLAAENKIMASEQKEYEEFGLGLDDATFSNWSAMMDKRTPNPLFAQYAAQASTEAGAPVAGGTPPSADQVSADDQELADAKARVRQHTMAGMDKELIKKTASFTYIISREPNFQLGR